MAGEFILEDKYIKKCETSWLKNFGYEFREQNFENMNYIFILLSSINIRLRMCFIVYYSELLTKKC